MDYIFLTKSLELFNFVKFFLTYQICQNAFKRRGSSSLFQKNFHRASKGFQWHYGGIFSLKYRDQNLIFLHKYHMQPLPMKSYYLMMVQSLCAPGNVQKLAIEMIKVKNEYLQKLRLIFLHKE